MPLALRFAFREMRGGLAGFRIFIACLALGVAAIAGVGSLSSAIFEGLRVEGAALLGGDVEMELNYRRANGDELAYMNSAGLLSPLTQIRAMAYDANGDGRTLVEVKEVDAHYPLYGGVVLDPPLPLAEALAQTEEKNGPAWGAAVDKTLLDRLDLALGDVFTMGDARFVVRARLLREPDRGSDAFMLGPRVMVAAPSIATSGLVRLGSLVRYRYRLKLNPGVSPADWREATEEKFPDAGWRLRDRDNGAPGVRRFVDRMNLFLTLVGLAALVVGGVGVGNAVRGYLDGKTETIATLKCLGAPGDTVFRIYLSQIMLLALLGIAAGLIVGVLAPFGLAGMLGDSLPVEARVGFYPTPVALAAAYGVITALAFSIWPLGRAREVPPAGLFRDLIAPAGLKPRRVYRLAVMLAGAALAGLAISTAVERFFAVWFVLGVGLSFIILRGAASAVIALARRAGRPRHLALRHALADLYRPGAATSSVILSLGLGLSLIVAVALIEGNIAAQIDDQLPDKAPALFFLDIQSDQATAFKRTALAVPGVEDIDSVPSIRGRIAEIAGVPAGEAVIGPEARWAVRGDRAFSFAAQLPEASVLTEGEWWPADYGGPPLISLDASLGRGFGVGVGDTLTLNILGRDITATVANLRRIDWSTMSLNFAIIFAPGTLESAPHSYMATARVDEAAENGLFEAVTDNFANVTVIRVREALTAAAEILRSVGTAARATAAATLVSGILVLGGAIAAGHRRKVYHGVVFKVLGATRADVLKAYFLEYALLGLVTALLAGALGTLAAYMVITEIMEADWVFLPSTAVLVLAFSLSATLVLGLLGTWRALGAKPARVLRTD